MHAVQDPDYSVIDRLEAAKKVAPNGASYWTARELQAILGYDTWERFEGVIARAIEGCERAGKDPARHLRGAAKMFRIGNGGVRKQADFILTRYACYLVAMNGDPRKREIAAAQTYFAIQTRRMELEDQSRQDQKRLELRKKVTGSFKRVSNVARDAGVANQMQPVFHDARYRGLYGKSLKELKKYKGLEEKEQLFDRIGVLELSANDFQMNLAADVIVRQNIKGQQAVIKTNQEVGERVQKTMVDSGTSPADLPLEPPIKEVEKRLRGKTVGRALPSPDDG